MDDRGFTLIEVILALFLLGLIAVTFLPLINTALENIRLSNERNQMLLLAETVMEQIKHFNYESSENSYILDMKIVNIIDVFSKTDNINVNLPKDKDKDKWPYVCHIHKKNINDKLWAITITISYNGEKKIKNVVLQTYMEKIEKD